MLREEIEDRLEDLFYEERDTLVSLYVDALSRDPYDYLVVLEEAFQDIANEYDQDLDLEKIYRAFDGYSIDLLSRFLDDVVEVYIESL